VNEESPEAKLWKEFSESKCGMARARLVEMYIPLARAIAGKMYQKRIDDSLPFNDYLQYGQVGLLEAVDRFQWNRHVSFGTFSTHRIRGSILNGLARESEQAAQQRFWRRRSEQRVESLRTALAPDADRASLADIAMVTAGLVVGALLDDARNAYEPADLNEQNDPYAVNELEQLHVQVKHLLTRLPEKERVVIHGHYVEGVDFEVVAARLGLTKGRVSQLHTRALLRIREWLSGKPKLDEKL
jgi:RNA polymerase sigma factor FliA